MSIVKTLIKIRNLIYTPEKWTKGAFARDENYHTVSINDERCYYRCLTGAIFAIVDTNDGEKELQEVYTALIDTLSTDEVFKYCSYHSHYRRRLEIFNDHKLTTHSHVLYLMKQTINKQGKLDFYRLQQKEKRK